MKLGARWWKITLIILGVLIVLVLLRKPIMRGMGNYLIDESPLERVEVAFVLGGNSYDRGAEALKMYKEGYAEKLVCTGGNIPLVLAALDTSLYEAEVSSTMLVKRGVPERNVDALTGSTSTMEESEEILKYCQDNGYNNIMIISSKFHLRRVRNVFEDKFKENGIRVCFHGAGSSHYDEGEWWNSEGGLIMVNNEYMKLLYYLMK